MYGFRSTVRTYVSARHRRDPIGGVEILGCEGESVIMYTSDGDWFAIRSTVFLSVHKHPECFANQLVGFDTGGVTGPAALPLCFPLESGQNPVSREFVFLDGLGARGIDGGFNLSIPEQSRGIRFGSVPPRLVPGFDVSARGSVTCEVQLNELQLLGVQRPDHATDYRSYSTSFLNSRRERLPLPRCERNRWHSCSLKCSKSSGRLMSSSRPRPRSCATS